MKLGKYVLLTAVFISFVHAENIVVRLPSGESITVKVESDESFATVLSRVDNEIFARDEDGLDKPREFVLDYRGGTKNMFMIHSRANLAPRNFNASLTVKEKEDIQYIVNSMGHASLAKLATSKSSLKKAGGRVDHIHPLRFVMTAFLDEKMKVSMLQVQSRGWVWSEFIDGMGESFDQEAKAGNLKDEYIQEMASQLKIDANIIKPIIRAGKWKDLVAKLSDILPRNGDPDRYQ